MAFVISSRYFDTSQRKDVLWRVLFNNIFYLRVVDLFISFLIPCTVTIALYLRIFYVVHQQVKS